MSLVVLKVEHHIVSSFVAMKCCHYSSCDFGTVVTFGFRADIIWRCSLSEMRMLYRDTRIPESGFLWIWVPFFLLETLAFCFVIWFNYCWCLFECSLLLTQVLAIPISLFFVILGAVDFSVDERLVGFDFYKSEAVCVLYRGFESGTVAWIFTCGLDVDSQFWDACAW